MQLKIELKNYMVLYFNHLDHVLFMSHLLTIHIRIRCR